MKHRVDERFFRPRGLALVGASADPKASAGRPLHNARVVGYGGGIYPVNPKYRELAGLPCYSSVTEIPGPVDLSLITVPARLVPQVLVECGTKGIAYNIITSAGFAEAGASELQRRIQGIAKDCGIHLIGPNCVGMINLVDRVVATFSTFFEKEHELVPGNIGLVSQSGGLGVSLVNSCETLGTPVVMYVSTGNEADLGALDFVEAFLEEPGIRVVSGFIESFNRGEDLVRLGALAVERRKPMVFLRAVGSERARAAALSHTGKIAGAAAVSRAVLRQAGVVEVEDPGEFLDAVHLFSLARVFPGNGLASLSISGGMAVLVANLCDQWGLKLPEFAPETQRALAPLLPDFAARTNPVDTTPPKDIRTLPPVVEAVLADPAIHSLLLTFPGRYYNALASEFLALGEAAEAAGKLLILSTRSIVGTDGLDPAVAHRFRAAGVPVFESPVRAVRALGRLVSFGEQLRHPRPAPHRVVPAPRVAAPTDPGDAGPLLAAYGIPFVGSRLASSAEEAERAAGQLGYPVALKIVSPQVAHKTEAGGVALGLEDGTAVRKAFERIVRSVRERVPEASIEGVEVQQMVPTGFEAMVGALRDPEFGPVVTVGCGGVLAELVADAQYRLAPVEEAEARRMIADSRLGRLLEGYRGGAPGDVEALVDCVVKLSRLIAAEGWIGEIEMNPVIVGAPGAGARAVDALIVSRR